MAEYSRFRIASYIATILLHVSNMVYMAASAKPLKEDPDLNPALKKFFRLQSRYFTCWNFGLQVIFASIALFCEVLILRNATNKDYKLNKHLKALRDIMFASVIWPCTMLVFSLFWVLYLLNRDLIFPKYLDVALTPLSNHVIHTLIVPIALCEIVFRPRLQPKSHKRNLFHLLVHLLVYLCVLVYTYKEHGIWIYPIFDRLYGTVYFPIALIAVVVIAMGYYYLQWVLTSLVWGNNPKKTK